jgi:ankyrin repeat protein
MNAGSDIFDAIENGDAARVRALLRDEPGVAAGRDENGLSALLKARYYGRSAIVDELLSVGLELDVFEASTLGRVDRVRELVDGAPQLVNAWSADGFTPLHLASYFGHDPVDELLLARGADVAAVSRNSMRVTPLHSAIAGAHPDIARRLIEADADVNARQQDGFTPLHAAAQNGDAHLAELLLSQGADPDARLDDGRTAADLAGEHGHDRLALGL